MAAGGAATAAGPHVGGKTCGTKYTPKCKKNVKKHKKHKVTPPPTKPTIQNRPVNPRCVDVGGRFKLPQITLNSAAGMRRIQIVENGKTIRTINFKGNGPKRFTLKTSSAPTTGLHAGGQNLSVRVTDSRGRAVSKTLRFSVCVTTPVFTG